VLVEDIAFCCGLVGGEEVVDGGEEGKVDGETPCFSRSAAGESEGV